MEPCGQPQIGRLPSPPGAIPHPHIAEKTAECYIERWNFTSRKRGQRMKGRGKSRISRSRFLRRFLGHESLESRNLLATMAAFFARALPGESARISAGRTERMR